VRNIGFVLLVAVFGAVIGLLLCTPGEEIEVPYLPEPTVETTVIVEPLPDIAVEGTVPIRVIPVTDEVIDSLIAEWGEEEYEEIAQEMPTEEISLNDLRHAEYDTVIVDSVYGDSLNIHVDVSWFPLNENARVRVKLTSRSKIREQMTITQPVIQGPESTWHFEAGVYYGRSGESASMALYSCVYHDRFPLGIGFIGTAETVLIGINVRLK